VQKHEIEIKHTSILCFTMKMQPEEGQTRIELEKEQQPHGSFQFLQGINTKSLSRHGIRNTTQTETKLHFKSKERVNKHDLD